MSNLTFDLDTTKTLPNKPLADIEKELISATVGFGVSPPAVVGITFKLSAEANGKIEAYNEPNDKDEDGVLGMAEKDEDAFGPIVLPPSIVLSDQAAWLKYRFQASAGVTAQAKVAPIGFKIDANKKIIFADYRVHDRNENTIAAAASDIPNLRFTGNADDAFKLGVNEALYYGVRGEFSASVTLTWSDVFSAGLSQIASNLTISQLLMFEIDASASVEFHVGVVDDFQLVLTKGSGSKVRVALKKSKSDEIGMSGGFQIKAKFADEAKVKEILDKVYEATLGIPLDKIEEILGAPANQLNKLISELPDPLKGVVETLISRLKLDAPLQTLNDIKEQIEAFEKKIKDTLESVAKAKVELGFKYEYLRTRTDDTLFIVQLDEETFKLFHRDLMLCDFINLLEWAKKPENSDAVERYLNQKTLERTESWGFTLGFMKWKLSGKDKKQLISIVQTNDLQNPPTKRIAYRGMRGYQASFGVDFNWAVDFKAEMNRFSAKPTANDFEFGLHIRRSWETTINAGNLREFLDDALIWKVLTLNNAQDAIGKIGTDGNLNKDAKVSVELTVGDNTFRSLISKISSADNVELGSRALAMAMDYNEMFPTRADNLGDRERLYTALWRDVFFKNPNKSVSSYADDASSLILHLENPLTDEQTLAVREKAHSHRDTFAEEIGQNGGSAIKSRWVNFTGGLALLHSALAPGSTVPHKVIEDVFNDSIQPFCAQSLYIRAVGVYLVRLAAEIGVLGEINRVCTVTVGDTVYSFGKSN